MNDQPDAHQHPGEDLPPAEVHAQMFARLREAHATEVLEDYVEMIADLIEANGEARIVDVYISYLRRKFDAEVIQSARGRGYSIL